MDADLFAWLSKGALATTAAIVLVLLSRDAIRARFGSGAAYALWWLLPVAMLAACLPARTVRVTEVAAPSLRIATQATAMAGKAQAPAISAGTLLLWAWIAGVLLVALLLVVRQWRFRAQLGRVQAIGRGMHRAQSQAGLPAVTGVLLPRILLPSDFEARYSDEEQQLVLQHERIHLRRGDLQANAAFALLRCLHWFNPLVHIALDRFRRDQELACDEAVIRRHPHSRRAYGEAMLKTQLADGALPFGCHWRGEHPLKERIAMLKRPTPSRRQWLGGALACALLAMLTGFSVWAAQPATEIGNGDVRYAVERKTFIDGKDGGNLTQIASAGVTMTSVVGQGAARWENAMTVTPGSLPGQVAVRMEIRHGDPAKVVATPTAIVREGETGSIGRGAYLHEFRVVREGAPPPRNASAEAADSPFNTPGTGPLDTRLQGMNGKVVLLVDVAADGSYKSARVQASEPEGAFDAVALEAVKAWKFTPARKDGKPVAGRASVTMFWDTGMKPAAAPPGRKDGDRYNWSTIDRRISRIVPEGTCQVLIPVDAHVVTCGQKKTTVLQ